MFTTEEGSTPPVHVDANATRWIRQRRVCYEVSPLREIDHGGAVHVGFELTLFAEAGHDDPGSPELHATHERLKEIVAAVLPHDVRPTAYAFEPFDAAWHLRPQTNWRPEVQLVVRIIHREGYLRPADACESRCVREIQDGLRRAGIPEKGWLAGERLPTGSAAG